VSGTGVRSDMGSRNGGKKNVTCKAAWALDQRRIFVDDRKRGEASTDG
jgi:hypothetical protein